ncbi:TAXI family TRAP transporter solute-binding subunit [Rhodoblastus sp.]|jgi:TRAP-type uncharacterized transport system substrate-binding protein|uniref:TAXI family TRAP transporter solute-binding subunit n=1 Tax=Rhodoblastus sp. TaxID=1962975 RepID=UPI0025EFA53B|nr:TAXI family TRAP transporter solute-binding subunit [Rhodoblastus sp.]
MGKTATQRRVYVSIGLGLCVGLLALAYIHFTRPVTLTLAVGPSGFEDSAFAASLARALASSGSRVRISVHPTAGPTQARELLKDRKVQLAIIRNEGQIPSNVRAVAILHSDPVAIVAPKAAKIDNLRELANKTIGLIGPPSANADLMAAFRQHYRGKFQAVEIPPGPGQVAAALNAKQVDAVLFLAPTTRATVVSEGWAVVRRATGKSLDLVPIDDAEAFAASFPAYEEAEIPAGQLAGAPPVPAAAVDSLQVSTYLVADQSVKDDLVAELTRFLFENRHKLVADAPVASLMKVASTDKDAVIPAHTASASYFDGEEETFMERYIDWLWIGPMLAGGVFSALVGLWRFVGFSKGSADADLLERVPAVIDAIRAASSLEELDAIRTGIDAAVGRLSLDTVEGKLEDSNVNAVTGVVAYLDRLLSEKRLSLEARDRALEVSRHL